MTRERPRVLVDMDGPLADFDRAFFDLCAREGWAMDCTQATQRHRFATDHIPDKAERQAARDTVDGTHWFRDLPVTLGAVEGIELLAEHVDVWIASKPLEANPWCRDDKAAWLRDNFGPKWVRRLILLQDKSCLDGDVLLDDAPNPTWFQVATWVPVVFPAPFNATDDRWADLPHWGWHDNVADLVVVAEESMAVPW